MAAVQVYPRSAALDIASTIRTSLAASKLCLFKENIAVLTDEVTLDQVTPADYSGYAQKTIANFDLPYHDDAGGASIQSGTWQFDYVEPDPGPGVANQVYGWYLLTSAGDLFALGTFDTPRNMSENGDATSVNVVLSYGGNA